MLQRPEIGTREHILLWLASKPANESFYWLNPDICACGQYSKEFFGDSQAWGGMTGPILHLNNIAGRLSSSICCPIYWGDLYDAARKAWS